MKDNGPNHHEEQFELKKKKKKKKKKRILKLQPLETIENLNIHNRNFDLFIILEPRNPTHTYVSSHVVPWPIVVKFAMMEHRRSTMSRAKTAATHQQMPA